MHRGVAVRCFNETWTYLKKKDRTSAEDINMLELAHTSLFHWSIIGGPRERAIGEWQVSRAYASLGDADLSLLFAESCFKTCLKVKLPWLLVSAYEGLARAYAAGGGTRRATTYIDKAKKAIHVPGIPKDERNLLQGQINETEKMITASRPKQQTANVR